MNRIPVNSPSEFLIPSSFLSPVLPLIYLLNTDYMLECGGNHMKPGDLSSRNLGKGKTSTSASEALGTFTYYFLNCASAWQVDRSFPLLPPPPPFTKLRGGESKILQDYISGQSRLVFKWTSFSSSIST